VVAPEAGPSLEMVDLVARGLGVLDETSRDAVLLRFFSDLPVKEVADVLGKGESATKMVLHRALARMRDALAEDQGA
jgi:RNA polymerase sigma-70 factor (ECF subfamily)